MRFEGKHNYFKKSLTVSSNNINLPYSLAVKSQIHLADVLLNFDFENENLEKFGEKLDGDEKNFGKIISMGKVLTRGVVFECFDKEFHLMSFKKVEKIAEKEGKIILNCRNLENPQVCHHFDCYRVENVTNFVSFIAVSGNPCAARILWGAVKHFWHL